MLSTNSTAFLNNSSLNLHHAINHFTQTQLDKTALQKKLNILKHKCQSNRKKAKVIKNKVHQIQDIKEEYQKHKQQLQKIQWLENELHRSKINKEKTLREQSKENMHIIRNMIAEEKSQDYMKVKEREKINQIKINQRTKKTLDQKRQRSLQVRLQEEQSKLNRTLYLEHKKINAQRKSAAEILPIQAGTERITQYISQMKLIEKEMTDKFNHSTLNLKNSKLSLTNILK